MKKPRSEKPFPQSESLTYRTGSLAAETQERSVVCDGVVYLPADQDTTRLCPQLTHLAAPAFHKMEGAPLRHFRDRPWYRPLGSEEAGFREGGDFFP